MDFLVDGSRRRHLQKESRYLYMGDNGTRRIVENKREMAAPKRRKRHEKFLKMRSS
jgi:hypothetical protein